MGAPRQFWDSIRQLRENFEITSRRLWQNFETILGMLRTILGNLETRLGQLWNNLETIIVQPWNNFGASSNKVTSQWLLACTSRLWAANVQFWIETCWSISDVLVILVEYKLCNFLKPNTTDSTGGSEDKIQTIKDLKMLYPWLLRQSKRGVVFNLNL